MIFNSIPQSEIFLKSGQCSVAPSHDAAKLALGLLLVCAHCALAAERTSLEEGDRKRGKESDRCEKCY